MRYLFAFLVISIFAGCATGREDAEFFNTGWMHPEQGANERMYKNGAGVPGEERRQ